MMEWDFNDVGPGERGGGFPIEAHFNHLCHKTRRKKKGRK